MIEQVEIVDEIETPDPLEGLATGEGWTIRLYKGGAKGGLLEEIPADDFDPFEVRRKHGPGKYTARSREDGTGKWGKQVTFRLAPDPDDTEDTPQAMPVAVPVAAPADTTQLAAIQAMQSLVEMQGSVIRSVTETNRPKVDYAKIILAASPFILEILKSRKATPASELVELFKVTKELGGDGGGSDDGMIGLLREALPTIMEEFLKPAPAPTPTPQLAQTPKPAAPTTDEDPRIAAMKALFTAAAATPSPDPEAYAANAYDLIGQADGSILCRSMDEGAIAEHIRANWAHDCSTGFMAEVEVAFRALVAEHEDKPETPQEPEKPAKKPKAKKEGKDAAKSGDASKQGG